MKTTFFSEKIAYRGILCVLVLMLTAFTGCAWLQGELANVQASLAEEPENAAPPTNTAPTLSTLSISPNPAVAGKTVILTAKYEDIEANLEQGMAAISINGAEPLIMSFRTTYPSGLLTLSVPITSYARSSDLRVALKIRDDNGNWSNLVSTVVTVE